MPKKDTTPACFYCGSTHHQEYRCPKHPSAGPGPQSQEGRGSLAAAHGSVGMTPIPGIKAHHRWITDTCRANRGDVGAMSEAAQTLQLELLRLYKHWPTGKGTRFHIVLTVEEASSPNTKGEP